MKDIEILPNGIEVVFAFGEVKAKHKKKILFLAGTTSWKSDLVEESWRRHFLKRISEINSFKNNIVVCVPEPHYGSFRERSSKHLIEWESEYLDLASVHAYWLNTYWTFEQAIQGCSKVSLPFFSDGSEANIGVTVRTELGCSFGRHKFGKGNFRLIVGAPHDAEGLAWLHIQSRILGLPVYTLYEKHEVFDNEWFNAIVNELNS